MTTLNRIKQPFVGKQVACVDFSVLQSLQKELIQKGSENWSTFKTNYFLWSFLNRGLYGSSHRHRDENAADKNVRRSLFR